MPDFKCREGLRQLVELVERNDSDALIFFHVSFLPIVDEALSQLIRWAEGAASAEVKSWAGTALSERLRFLSSQEKAWSDGNEAFAAAQKQFGDRRRARTPLSYLGWLAGDYVRVIDHDRHVAAVYLDSKFTGGISAADVLAISEERKQWLTRIAALEEFCPKSAPKWAQIVFERMLQDEEQILRAPQMRKRNSRESRTVRKSGAVRLGDFGSTIIRAVVTLATKPKGQVRGVTRPGI